MLGTSATFAPREDDQLTTLIPHMLREQLIARQPHALAAFNIYDMLQALTKPKT